MKMRAFSWRSISLQIVLAVLLPLTAGAIFIAFYSQNLHHTAMQSLVGERNLRTVETLAGTVDEIIRDRISVVEALAGTTLEPGFLSQPQAATKTLLQSFPAGVVWVDPDGKILDQTAALNLSVTDMQNVIKDLAGNDQN